MTNTKTTKRALVTSVLSIVICLTMLIGSTFAWFTDSATTGVNVIKSGNLEIGFEYADGTEAIETAKWENAEGAEIFNYEKWEPGYTVAKHIKITNKGTLAFKYELDFMLSSPVGKLAEVIDVYFADPAVQVADRTDATNLEKVKYVGTLKEFLEDTAIDPENGYLLEGASATVTIVLKMQESAGNIYQNETVGEGLTVAIFATQYTYESDSFNDQYDANAPTLVMIDDKQYDNIAAAIAAAEDNATIKLSGKFELPAITSKTITFDVIEDNYAVVTVPKNLDCNGATITFNNVTIKGYSNNANKNDWYTEQFKNATKVVYNNCTIEDLITAYVSSDFKNCVFKNTFDDQYSVYCYGNGTFNFEDCIFNTVCSKAIKVFDEGNIAGAKTVNVNGCKFNANKSNKAPVEIDSTRRADKGDYLVNISNCTVNKYYSKLFNLEGTNAKVTVDGKLYVAASTQDEINEALNSATGPVELILSKGTYTDIFNNSMTNKNVTFSGTNETVIDASAQEGVNGVPDLTNTTITFDGVTVKWKAANEGYHGIKNPKKVVYKNCTIEGTQFMYSGADFINCTFKTGTTSTTEGYAVYTRAAGDYTFTDCNFITGGRAVMMYNDDAVEANVTMTNCTFSDDGTYTSKAKAVVETGDNPNSPEKTSKFDIIINKYITLLQANTP